MNKQREALKRLYASISKPPMSPLEKMWVEIIEEALAEPDCDQCKKCNAYKTLVASLESELSWHRKKASEYQQAIATLDSERRANEILTNEIAKPSARKPLTEPELHAIEPTWPNGWNYDDVLVFVRSIERAHGIGEA